VKLKSWSRDLASLSTYRRKVERAVAVGYAAVAATRARAELVRFGVVIPVHDEERLIPQSLEALDRAMAAVADVNVDVGIAIILDRCSDGSGELVEQWRRRTTRRDASRMVGVLETDAGNVGQARKLGCRFLLQGWSDVAPSSIWLATTDADSEVPQDWISSQLKARVEGGQVWVGAVSVCDWSERTPGTEEAWRRQYEAEYLPIHGANLGIAAGTYLAAGGFEALSTGEDRDLFDRAVTLGAVVRRDSVAPVVTSSRLKARAPHGFAHALSSLERAIPTLAIVDQGERYAS
jgi:Glycosyl transferase family 2